MLFFAYSYFLSNLVVSVFAGLPAARGQVFLRHFLRLRLQRRGQAVVPAIEESEQAYHAQQFDSLALRPVALQLDADALRAGERHYGSSGFLAYACEITA